MARASGARLPARGSAQVIDDAATWPDEQVSAYESARLAVQRLRPGRTILYHVGQLAIDASRDPILAGRAAAFRDAATEWGSGILIQRRLGCERFEYIFRKSGHD